MSLYAEYLKEREGFDILEMPEGYATYKITGNECYLRDLYVRSTVRNKGTATSMADTICSIAKEFGCKWLIGSVSPAASHSTESVKHLLNYNMKLLKSEKDMIYFIKELT